MRLASLLTHLYRCFSTFVVNKDEYNKVSSRHIHSGHAITPMHVSNLDDVNVLQLFVKQNASSCVTVYAKV